MTAFIDSLLDRIMMYRLTLYYLIALVPRALRADKRFNEEVRRYRPDVTRAIQTEK